MKALLAAAVFLVPAARAAQPAQVARGDLTIRVDVTGTIAAEDVVRIKAPIEGRVESVLASTFAWSGAGRPLALLADRELAAMLDSRGAQDQDVLEDRWRGVYKTTPVRCLEACFILRNFMKAKSWVKPRALLFEAARTLKMVARVRPEDTRWIRDGQEFAFRSIRDHKMRGRGRVTDFALDARSGASPPGGSFVFRMSPDFYFDPGTDWEGKLIILLKKDALLVPTGALLRHGGAAYLPVRVSTGITTQGLTELAEGAEEGRDILILDDSQLSGARRHAQEAAPPPGPAPAREPDAANRHPGVLDGADYGEDPYGEPQ